VIEFGTPDASSISHGERDRLAKRETNALMACQNEASGGCTNGVGLLGTLSGVFGGANYDYK
jgi:hypothetical protein